MSAAVARCLLRCARAGRRRRRTAATRSTPTASRTSRSSSAGAAGYDMTEGRPRVSTSRSSPRAARSAQLRAKQGVDRRSSVTRSQALARARATTPASDASTTCGRRYDARPGRRQGAVRRAVRPARRSEPIAKLVGLAPQTHLGRDDLRAQDHQGREDDARQLAPGRALQRAAARARVAGRRDLPAHARLHRRQLRPHGPRSTRTATRSPASRRGSPSCRHARSGSCASRTRTATSTRSPPGNRLWRKNMADNDGDGDLRRGQRRRRPEPQLRAELGPATRRAPPTDPTSETYRGTGAGSEPETQAMKSLWDMVDFTFQKNDHTAAELLLYPQGFQQYTPTPDNGDLRGARRQRRDSAIPDGTTRRDVITGNRFDPACRRALHHQRRQLDDAYHSHGHPRLHARGHRVRRDTSVTGLRVRGRRGRRSRRSSCATCRSRST